MNFNKERGIAYCGLACVLCSSTNCSGCVSEIVCGKDCAIGKCAVQKGVDGCYACPDYPGRIGEQDAKHPTSPCDEGMLQNKRIRAFNRYAQEFGKDALIERLYVNNQNGIAYHKPDESAGDYDVLETEDKIYELLRYGQK